VPQLEEEGRCKKGISDLKNQQLRDGKLKKLMHPNFCVIEKRIF
jgi:hypothetical protein